MLNRNSYKFKKQDNVLKIIILKQFKDTQTFEGTLYK